MPPFPDRTGIEAAARITTAGTGLPAAKFVTTVMFSAGV
jgi:hypothetical protein